MRLRAHEITLVHGLVVDSPIRLASGTYFASYDYVRTRFGLPRNPESWLTQSGLDPGQPNRSTALSVLVRPLAWGPGVFRCTCHAEENQCPTLNYRFPDEYAIDSWDRFFGDRNKLIDLLSVVTQSKTRLPHGIPRSPCVDATP